MEGRAGCSWAGDAGRKGLHLQHFLQGVPNTGCANT